MVVVRQGVDAFLTHNGRVLLGKRKKTATAFAGHWELPGGKIEEGETPQQALVREIQEELGVHVAVKDHIHSYESVNDGVHYIWKVYHADLLEEPQLIQMKDHEALRWIRNADDLQGLQMNDVIRKAIISCLPSLRR